MTKSNQFLFKAAVAGIIGAAAVAVPVVAHADDAKVHCEGANACKGKSGCKTDHNACAGKNACKGKGWTEMTKADCDAHKAKQAKPEEKK